MAAARRRLGKYELVARIGEGGMADVHLARQLGPRQFEKLVVVKTVKPALASRPDLAAMLLDEARLAALVKHANVVDIYDLGEADGTFFIAMEYLEGESLSAVLVASRAGPRLDPFSTTRIICDCAAGLHAAHELRNLLGEPMELVHQDVTPGNVIVLYSGQIKLVDFGVAKATTSADDGLIKGKTGYLAPELLDRAPADRRSDIWSLGVVLWESLTLRRLFSGKTEEEQFARIRKGEIPPPSRLNPAVPRELDDVCLTALLRDPATRFQTAHDMQVELEQILRHASWSTHAPIAKFMREVFASRLAARRELLREVATTRGPRATTLDQITAIVDEEPSGDSKERAVEGSHGMGARPPEPATPSTTPVAPAATSKRRRNAVIATLFGAAAIAGVAVGAVAVRANQAADAPSADAAVIASGGDHGARKHAMVDAGMVAVIDDAAVEVVTDATPAVVVDDDDHHHHRHHDHDGSGSASGSGSGSGSASGTDARPAAPTTAKALYKEGLQKFVGGDATGALALFEQARKKDSGYAPAYRGMGMAYEKLGKRKKAADAFRTYLKLAPDASDAAGIQARLKGLE